METITEAPQKRLKTIKPVAVHPAIPTSLLDGTETEFDDPRSIASEERRLLTEEGAYTPQRPTEDWNDFFWDDKNDFEAGYYSDSIPVGINGKPLDTELEVDGDEGEGNSSEDDEEVFITRIPVLIRCGLDSSRLPLNGAPGEDASSLLAFAAAWRKVNADPHKPAKLTYIHNPPIDPDDRLAPYILPDVLVIWDGEVKHEMAADAFYKALDPHLGEPDLPYLVEPNTLDDAKRILQIMNTISIDGYQGNFGQLDVVDKYLQIVGRVKAENRIYPETFAEPVAILTPIVEAATAQVKATPEVTAPKPAPKPAEVEPTITAPEPDFFEKLRVLIKTVPDITGRMNQIQELFRANRYTFVRDTKQVKVYCHTLDEKSALIRNVGDLKQALGTEHVWVKQIAETSNARI